MVQRARAINEVSTLIAELCNFQDALLAIDHLRTDGFTERLNDDDLEEDRRLTLYMALQEYGLKIRPFLESESLDPQTLGRLLSRHPEPEAWKADTGKALEALDKANVRAQGRLNRLLLGEEIEDLASA